MEKEKRYMPNTQCVFFKPYEDWHDAPVLCTRKEIKSGKCQSCGFNPEVKRKRFSEKHGPAKAEELCRYSESLNGKGLKDDS